MLLWSICSAHAADSLHIIELKHQPAADVAPVVQPLLRPDEALSATGYRLIVRATDARAAEIEKLVRQIDVERRQLMLTVRQTSATTSDSSNHGVSGEVEVGKRGRVVVPAPSEPNRGGVTVRRDGIEYRGQNRSTTGSSEQTHQLRVLDGTVAYIRSGQSIAQVQRILSLSGGRPVIIQGVALQDVTTGFEVRPQVRGDMVQLDITPHLATVADARRGLVNFQDLRTTVNVRIGDWVDLGQILGTRSEINRAILDSASERADERRTILLKVE